LTGKNNKLRNDIEQSLLKGLQREYQELVNVNIYLFKENKIIITFTNIMPTFDNPIALATSIHQLHVKDIYSICVSNPQSVKTCNYPEFWWTLIKLKFPEYHKDILNGEYNPAELVAGFEYFKDNQIDNSLNLYQANAGSHLKRFVVKYRQAFKYLLMEDLWNIDESLITTVFSLTLDDIEILKRLIEKFGVSKFVAILEASAINQLEGLITIKELQEWMVSTNRRPAIFRNKQDMNQFFRQRLANIFLGREDHTIEYYETISNFLNRPVDDIRYLDDYISTAGTRLGNYILSKISPNVYKEVLIEKMFSSIHQYNIATFVELYEKFKYKFDDIDKHNMIKIIKSRYVDHQFKEHKSKLINLIRM
jgi:hypothetical protein